MKSNRHKYKRHCPSYPRHMYDAGEMEKIASEFSSLLCKDSYITKNQRLQIAELLEDYTALMNICRAEWTKDVIALQTRLKKHRKTAFLEEEEEEETSEDSTSHSSNEATTSSNHHHGEEGLAEPEAKGMEVVPLENNGFNCIVEKELLVKQIKEQLCNALDGAPSVAISLLGKENLLANLDKLHKHFKQYPVFVLVTQVAATTASSASSWIFTEEVVAPTLPAVDSMAKAIADIITLATQTYNIDGYKLITN